MRKLYIFLKINFTFFDSRLAYRKEIFIEQSEWGSLVSE